MNIDQEDKTNQTKQKTYNGCNTGDYADDISMHNKITKKQKNPGVLYLRCRFSFPIPVFPKPHKRKQICAHGK